MWKNLKLIDLKLPLVKIVHKSKIKVDTHSVRNLTLLQCFLSLCLPNKDTPEQAATIPQHSLSRKSTQSADFYHSRTSTKYDNTKRCSVDQS